MKSPGRVTVQGLGHFGGGAGVARFLAREGWQVTVTDLQTEEELCNSIASLADVDVRFVLGRHDEDDFTDTDLVVANPAVNPNNKHLAAARSAGVRVVSEVGLFLDRAPGCVVAVTGTQGKSSTAHFLYQLLVDAKLPTRLGGNIGGSLLDELQAMTAEETCVVELSSYQLEGLAEEVTGTPLDLAIITNLREDHLERHGTAEAYHAAKLGIAQLLSEGAPLLMGAGVIDRARTLAPEDTERVDLYETGALLRLESESFSLRSDVLGDVSDAKHLPEFQRENLLLALGAARLLGAPASLLAASIPTLSGLSHRLEDLGELRGRHVYDNGVSTTPDSTEAALEALPTGVTLLAGGQAKALSIDGLVRAAKLRARQVVLFGACAKEWAHAFRESGTKCEVVETVADAVEVAWSETERGDAVLFSPAAASFDAYKNFRSRAMDFRRCLTPQGEVSAPTS
jgi:UDP-N-acetylmuramoylalanine--D-glutamate ligase